MRTLPPTPARRGVTLVETLVSLSLLITTLGLVATLAVRNQRVIADQRAYRLAVDELTERLERLTALPTGEARSAHERMNSEPLGDRLAGATVSAAFDRVDGDRRITLTLAWPGEVRQRPDVTLIGWGPPSDEPADAAQPEEDRQPEEDAS